ncbi:protein Networked (NET), actin-binding (NAB) domain-containing protein [Artemisia annua]|uniref:Protein Networked (NET), actin-binding (NAB) domain-containing protein n=1 Tax=Artemisia annua TaxID=35608 RepID=A0A2U1N7V0_ARTAN|nr:protein Networked (NET), actin-binding (NAB) domain-containing protein [Artemisia annua]
MTQRATSKGYSWWWASHIRTKQSKWLEQNLQDMEDKVEHVLNLIQKDGDSFARRAEMYYKHRPDVISFVEETVRAYRSLAERYDKLSTELAKANTTIASICPDKVEYNDDDDYTVGPSNTTKNVRQNTTKIPEAPKLPGKKSKGSTINNAAKKTVEANPSNDKSSDETIEMLQAKQEKLTQEVKLEHERYQEVKQKLESLKRKFDLNQVNNVDESKSNNDENKAEELGETIDKLMNKMISLETSVSTQTSLTDTLKKENADLQTQIQSLEAEKAALMNSQTAANLESKKKEDSSWQEMLLNGLEDKDEILLEEYITILKIYKDTKKKLSEEEKRNQGNLSFMKSAIVKRDNKIQLLRQKLKFLQESIGDDKVDIPSIDFLDEPQVASASEEKLRMDIDAILARNLDFWLRFSTAFRQVNKFKKMVKDLQEEVNKVKTKGLARKSSTSMFTTDIISDIKPIYKNLKEMESKLTVWLQQSTLLKDEIQVINLCLSSIQEEITQALREGVEEDEIKFSTHHAAKFQGEILSIKQENNKVNEELQAGLDQVDTLKHEIEKTTERLELEFGLYNNRIQQRKVRSSGRQLTTLRSLIFGSKSKKQKKSCFFSCLGHHKKSTAYKACSI